MRTIGEMVVYQTFVLPYFNNSHLTLTCAEYVPSTLGSTVHGTEGYDPKLMDLFHGST